MFWYASMHISPAAYALVCAYYQENINSIAAIVTKSV